MYEAIPDTPPPLIREASPSAWVVDKRRSDTPVDSIPVAAAKLDQWAVKADKKIDQATGKVDLGLIPLKALYGAARVFAYGAEKYAPGNFYEAFLSDGASRRYISALLRHLAEMQEPNGLHPDDTVAARDDESGLPHIDHAICGLLMLRSILTKCGALPADPGGQ